MGKFTDRIGKRNFEVFQNEQGEFRLRAEARLAKELMNEH
jgi:hypothetical protein